MGFHIPHQHPFEYSRIPQQDEFFLPSCAQADYDIRISNPNLAKWISENLVFDQLILEFYDGKDPNSGWVHCSYKKDDTNRGDGRLESEHKS